MPAYFDHNAATPVHPDVFEAMKPYLTEQFGNASCLYRLGVDASYAVEKARMQLARLLSCSEDEIVFTSGGTESDNLALKGAVYSTNKKHIITTAIEHPGIIRTCEFMERCMDCTVIFLPVDEDGRVSPADVEDAITPDTALVSVMTANNEIGAIQPIAEIAAITKSRGVLFHSDAVQAVGRIEVNVEEMGVDLLSLSGHKFYGPKGVGALYVRKGVNLVSIQQGGGHEQGRRAGTENVAGIVGLGKAAVIARKEREAKSQRAAQLRDLLWQKLESLPLAVKRNSPAQGVLPGTLNITLPNINAREFVRAMDSEGFCIATGSACSTGKTTPSYVLKALGRSDANAIASVRISLGASNTEEEINRFVDILPRVVEQVSELTSA